jgi:competence protein ComEC
MAGNFKQKLFLIIIFLLTLSNLFIWKEVFSLDGNLKVIFFDVGQGDSIFIETPQGHQILIDGGPSGKLVLEKLSHQIPFWDKTIDLVVLTHPDYDHLAGLNYVLQRYEVENILWTGILKGTGTFGKWQKVLAGEKANIIIAKRGQIIKAGNVLFCVFYPFENLAGEFFNDTSNDTSVVLKLVFGKSTFLFTGDISKKTEKKLIEANSADYSFCQRFGIEAKVLKIAHHGSKSSTSREFLEEISPKFAVISVSKKNPYNHPHPEVLQRLKDFGIKVLRTDKLGDIKIYSDGNNPEFNLSF